MPGHLPIKMAAGPGTRVQLGTKVPHFCRRVKFQIIPATSPPYPGYAYVGGATVTDAAYGYVLRGGDLQEEDGKSPEYRLDISNIWVYFDQAGGGVACVTYDD